MRPLIDAHLDLAWSGIFWNRDLTRSLEEMRQAEKHITDHPARGRGTLTLAEMRNAQIRLCLGTVLVRSKPEVAPAAGSARRDLDFRNQVIASAVGHSHVQYYRELERAGEIRFIRNQADLQSHWNSSENEKRIGLILAMEGADPIVTPDRAQEWWDMGLRCVGLSHYGQGPYGMGTGKSGSITAQGQQLLKEFQRLGMIVDLTHSAEPGFFEILDQFSGRVLASHNMCRALVPGDRQFSDEQLRRLIERDAVIGMAFDAWMLTPGWVIGHTDPAVVSIQAAADHIDHICQLAGNARNIGIGSDLDGGFGTEQTPYDLNSITDLHRLEEILAGRGYSPADIDGIFYSNWLRFFSEALPKDSN